VRPALEPVAHVANRDDLLRMYAYNAEHDVERDLQMSSLVHVKVKDGTFPRPTKPTGGVSVFDAAYRTGARWSRPCISVTILVNTNAISVEIELQIEIHQIVPTHLSRDVFCERIKFNNVTACHFLL